MEVGRERLDSCLIWWFSEEEVRVILHFSCHFGDSNGKQTTEVKKSAFEGSNTLWAHVARTDLLLWSLSKD